MHRLLEVGHRLARSHRWRSPRRGAVDRLQVRTTCSGMPSRTASRAAHRAALRRRPAQPVMAHDRAAGGCHTLLATSIMVDPLGSAHQIRTRCSGSSQSPSPSAVPNTSWNSSRLRTMLARNSGGLCGSMVRYCWSCSLAALGPPAVGPVQEQPLPLLVGARRPCEIRYALWPMVRPPRSPMFSPTVSAPLTCSPGSVARLEAVVLLDQRLRLHLERRLVVGLHQSLRLPAPSYCAPWSSKPWPISWPITAPMPP